METNNLLQADLEKAKQAQAELPENIGVLTIKTANRSNYDASLLPDPLPLWDKLWMQGEMCCLYAESGAGKTIYAVQMAIEIAKKYRVIYCDFELTDKQFQLRYTDEEHNIYQFPDNFYRVGINQREFKADYSEMELIKNIEDVALQYDANVLIIDNITRICNNSEKGDVAGTFMMAMQKLKFEHNFSILIIAHTRKRNNLCYPISPDDLAGSKKLFNFFDSAFTIGKSAKDTGLRYIKQTKVRTSDFTYTANDAMLCEIVKDGAFTMFEKKKEHTTESEHLSEQSESDKMAEKMAIVDYKKKYPQASYRAIADALHVSYSNVQRTLKKAEITN